MLVYVMPFGFRPMSQELFGESFHLEILKEALLRTIADIDTRFSKVDIILFSELKLLPDAKFSL